MWKDYIKTIWYFGAIDCQLNAENRVIKTHLMSVSSSYYPLGWFTSCDPAQRPTSWIILELPLMELVWNSFWKKVWHSDTRGFQMFSTLWRKMEDTHKKRNEKNQSGVMKRGQWSVDAELFPFGGLYCCYLFCSPVVTSICTTAAEMDSKVFTS